jgi:hypothetical protein
MKQKDLTLIGIVIFVSIIISLIVSNKIFSSSGSHEQQVQVVPTITANFQKPNRNYFNSSSIDPTQLIQISPSNNSAPFNNPTASH